MRLLRTRRGDGHGLEFEEFQSTPPAYAILSHTWDIGEVTFADVQNNAYIDKQGYNKINYLMRQALDDGYEYAWIDTCCIDKGSSAELSEAIHSMFNWYKSAGICYAYMFDVDSDDQFENSRWFTRGWTLQELLAPRLVRFFSKQWRCLGDNVQLAEAITRTTGIALPYVMGKMPLDAASIAARMSWAAHRQVTREEDTAYCLLGLLGVSMSMLYGEGSRAFIRLQEEIIKISDDQSIFAWTVKCDNAMPHGLLADSPKAFRGAGHVFPYEDWTERQPFTVTNMGLSIRLFVSARRGLFDIKGTVHAILQCPGTQEDFLYVYLKRIAGKGDQYQRVQCSLVGETSSKGQLQLLYVPQIGPSAYESSTGYMSHPERLYAENVLYFRAMALHGFVPWQDYGHIKVIDAWPSPPSEALSTASLPTTIGVGRDPDISWGDSSTPRAFSLRRSSAPLVYVHLRQKLKHHGWWKADMSHEYIVIFGFNKESNLVYDFCKPREDIPVAYNHQNMSKIFTSHSDGTALGLDDIVLRLELNESIVLGRKIYYVRMSFTRVMDNPEATSIGNYRKAVAPS